MKHRFKGQGSREECMRLIDQRRNEQLYPHPIEDCSEKCKERGMCFALIVFELKYSPLASHTVIFKWISEKIKYCPEVISFMQTPDPMITFKEIIGKKWFFFLNLPLRCE